MSIAMIIAGLLVLVIGGEVLVRAAVALAKATRIPSRIVGLTVVAAGTSMPELVVSVRAAMAGSSDLALGNVLGSNVFNIAAVLGLSALILPLVVGRITLTLEWPALMLASVLAAVFAFFGEVGRGAAVVLMAFWAVFLALNIRATRHAPDAATDVVAVGGPPSGRLLNTGLSLVGALVGVGFLVAGAEMLVRGAVRIAGAYGVSEAVIGLTVVAAGTSLPELVTSVVAAVRKQTDLAISNVIGSNIFNICMILGVTAMVEPLRVPPTMVSRDVLAGILLAAVLLPMMLTGRRISRFEGALLVAGYVGYTLFLVRGIG